MRQNFWCVCGLVIAVLAVSSSVARAQTVAVGPYYATPAWDQSLACTTAANCPRFVVLANFSNQAVLDRETGLVWQQNPSSTQMTWTEAYSNIFQGCEAAVDGGRGGWRLPTFDELQSLFQPGLFAGLPPGHPFGANANGAFWSSTTNGADSSLAQVWGFPDSGSFSKTSSFQAWCVRGPAH